MSIKSIKDIQLLSRDEIVKEKWNGSVHYAINGNVFGYTWFLDFIAKDWVGLVEGDYLSVMPLVYRKNWLGRYELYQPDLMRAMGIYSVKALSALRIKSFLEAIPNQYRRIDINLNQLNRPPRDGSFKVIEKENQILSLHEGHEHVESQYSKAFKAQLEKAQEANLLPIGSIKPERLAEFFKENNKKSIQNDQQFHGLQRIMYNVLHRGTGFATAFAHPDTQELLAANFYISSHSRMISLVPVVSPKGKELGAMEMLKDYMVRSNSKRPLLLDFNTDQSDPYATAMGAQVEKFYQIKR